MARVSHHDEQGSIPIFMAVMVVLTAMVIVTLEAVDSDLRSSRRSGDSANALQVADAGINDAIQQAPIVPRTTSTFTRTGTLGSGTYIYTATRDANRPLIWLVDSLGTDLAGVQRRIRAQAVPGSIFNSPIFVNSSLVLSSGISLDSFTSGVSYAQMCTKRGIIGTNDPDHMQFTSGGGGVGVANCQKKLGINSAWAYSMDGCTSFGNDSQALPPTGPGKCPPPPDTFKTPPKQFSPPAVYAPGTLQNPRTADFSGFKLTCDPSKPLVTNSTGTTNVQTLMGDKIYYFTSSVELYDGCRVVSPTTSGGSVDPERPVFIYSAGDVKVGNTGGQGGSINAPPATSPANAVCGATAISSLSDGAGNPASYYCPLWSAGLRIRLLTASSVEIRSNNTRFWGAIEAPSGSFVLNGSGIEVWGAAVANTGSSNAQFTWHFDEGLAVITAGRYSVAAWREEGT